MCSGQRKRFILIPQRPQGFRINLSLAQTGEAAHPGPDHPRGCDWGSAWARRREAPPPPRGWQGVGGRGQQGARGGKRLLLLSLKCEPGPGARGLQ